MKIAVVVCYDQQKYVRAYTLRKGLEATPGVEIINIANTNIGILRYLEVPIKILKTRFTSKPDAYLVTFRGYEMLLYMVVTLIRKPIIFDEFINFTEWMDEHGHISEGTLRYKLFRNRYAMLARKCRVILADTQAHALYSSKLNKMSLDKYQVIPVGANEKLFSYDPMSHYVEPFTVFYYGSMLPLHGLKYVLDAAVELKDTPGVRFLFVGGKQKAEKACNKAKKAGANIEYRSWLDLEQIPKIAKTSGLTIGGPFGNTLQSRFVVTGKTYQFLSIGAPVLIGINESNAKFEDKLNCLMVPQANSQKLAESILWAYQHPKELQQIGSKGHQLYEEEFSQSVINKQVAKIVTDL